MNILQKSCHERVAPIPGGGGIRYSLGVSARILRILRPAKVGRSPFCLSINVHDEKVVKLIQQRCFGVFL